MPADPERLMDTVQPLLTSRAAHALRVEVLRGPDAGAVFACGDPPIRIGRGRENHVRLSDTSVSD